MHRRHLLAAAAAWPVAAQTALPAEIRMLVPFAAGGATDLLARRLQAILETQGTRLLVENLTGGGSMVAMARLAQSRPDGRVLGLASQGLIGQIAAAEIPLRLEQFTPLVRVAIDSSVIVVGRNSPLRSQADMIAALRRVPGPSLGAAGPVNTVGHLRALGLAQEVGGSFTYIGYNGASRATNELIGGHLDMALVKPNDVFGQIRSGEIRVISVLEDERLPQMPDIPCIREAGIDPHPYGRMPLMTYVNAPAGLPAPMREGLVTLFRDAVMSPAYQAKALEDGYGADGAHGEALADAIARTLEAIRFAQARARG